MMIREHDINGELWEKISADGASESVWETADGKYYEVVIDINCTENTLKCLYEELTERGCKFKFPAIQSYFQSISVFIEEKDVLVLKLADEWDALSQYLSVAIGVRILNKMRSHTYEWK